VTAHSSLWKLVLAATTVVALPWACASDDCTGNGGVCTGTPSTPEMRGGAPSANGGGTPRGGTKAKGGHGGAAHAGEQASDGGARENAGRAGASGGETPVYEGEGGGGTRGGTGGSTGGGGGTTGHAGKGGQGQGGGRVSAGGIDAAGGSTSSGGTGYVPRGGFGGSVNALCASIPQNPEPCGGRGGTGGFSGEGGAGDVSIALAASGNGGEGANDTWCPASQSSGGSELAAGGAPGSGGEGGHGTVRTSFPIDDLEDGDTETELVLGVHGSWFTEGWSCTQFPRPDAVKSSPATSFESLPSAYAMHTFATSYGLLGISFVQVRPTCLEPLDASGMTGIVFWAKGTRIPQMFRFTVRTTTVPTPENRCVVDPSYCYEDHSIFVLLGEDWRRYVVPFSSLGGSFIDPSPSGPQPVPPANAARIVELIWNGADPARFGGAADCFDFWIDDVAFYRDE